MTHLLVSVSLVLNQGEYGAAEQRHEALTDFRTLNQITWPLGSSEIDGFDGKMKIG